jgi:hypothetical protein
VLEITETDKSELYALARSSVVEAKILLSKKSTTQSVQEQLDLAIAVLDQLYSVL